MSTHRVLVLLVAGLVTLFTSCTHRSTGHRPVPVPPLPSPSGYWTANYNGPGNLNDIPLASCADKHGNVYVAGETETQPGIFAALLIKYDADGALQWAATFDGPAHDGAWFSALAVDSADNIIAAGTSSLDPALDAVIVKYDPSGHQLWVQSFNGASGNNDQFAQLAVDASNNIYVAGYTQNRSGYAAGCDFLAAKYGPDGARKWVQTFNGSADNRDVVYAMALDGSGNLYVTGTMASLPDDGSGISGDTWATLKYTSDGTRLWLATYRNPDVDPTWGFTPRSIAVDSKSNVIVTGWGAIAGWGEAITIKYGANGAEQWRQAYFDQQGQPDGGIYVGVDATDNIYVASNLAKNDLPTSEQGDTDFLAIKYSPTGTRLWAQALNGAVPQSFDFASMGILDGAGNLYLYGYAHYETAPPYNYGTMAAKFNSDGVLQWATEHGTNPMPYSLGEKPLALTLDSNGNVYTSAWVFNDVIGETVDILTLKNVNLIPQKRNPAAAGAVATMGGRPTASSQAKPSGVLGVPLGLRGMAPGGRPGHRRAELDSLRIQGRPGPGHPLTQLH